MSTTEDHKEAQVYELGYLVLPSIPEDGLAEVVTKIKSLIKKLGAKELDSEAPIHLDLAYSMSKVVSARKYLVDDAYIGWVKFECEPSVAPELKTQVEALEEVLRILLIKAPRETVFTFEMARLAQAEKDNPTPAPEAEVIAPEEVIETKVEIVPEEVV